eukprot:TRINITY_DN3394_c0_g1_i1.p1 TRINITY_DN3394_c0_g1~~TRINITY_DN3394_c0_g1_i1.p1  ORF type:complete len:618 (+),score=64.76 TRINITY_DN3394_c0_g1_i1:86-1939(+)
MCIRDRFFILLPSAHAQSLGFSPSTINAGDWVTVSWSGISLPELQRNTSEYICVQDSFCAQVAHMSAWIGVFGAHAPLDQIGPQSWACANPPWLATSPIKWKPVRSAAGSTKFRIEAARSELKFALFSNGTSYPILLVASEPLEVVDLSAPRHVHIALTDTLGDMRIMFESFALDANAVVRFGYSPGRYVRNASVVPSTYTKKDLCGPPATTHGWVDTPWFYSGVVSVPTGHSSVYYSVGSDTMGWSIEKQFKSPTVPSATSTLRITVLADVGETYLDGAQYHWMEPYAVNTTNGALHAWDTDGAVTLALAPGNGEVHTGKAGPPKGHTLSGLSGQALAGVLNTDVVVHIGDLAYATGYESEWDFFMSSIEPIASVVPYMIGQGNHERDFPDSGSAFGGGDSGGECGIPTQARFVMPTPSHRQDAGWFSWNQGPVHFLMMDTEMPAHNDSSQLLFLQSDLSSVDRSITPWVILMGHRPMYSSSDNPNGLDLANGPWWPDVEKVLLQHQVNLCLWGHVHNAEVTCPIYNGKCVKPEHPNGYAAPIHAVVGNGGQSLSHFPNASATYPPSWSEWRFAEFGYSTIEVSGGASLHMQFWADAVPSAGALVHSLWINRTASD